MTDFHAEARAALAAQVARIDDDFPSLAALYDLDALLPYDDLWQSARRLLRDRWTTPAVRSAWRDALLGAPPDDAFWIHSFDRMRGRGAALLEAANAWRSSPPDRMFQSHHHIAPRVDGVAAIHVMLLFDPDPVGAVEFVATRSSDYLIWAGVGMLDLGENEDLVDEVLRRSECRDAVLLALSCTFDQQHAEVVRQEHVIRGAHMDAAAKAEAQASLGLWLEGLPARHRAIAKALTARVDAGAILGPWMRHLVLSADKRPDVVEASQPGPARIALEALAGLTSAIELAQSTKPSVVCMVARAIAADGRNDHLAQQHWDEWVRLVLSEDESVETCGGLSWNVVADLLAKLPDPLNAWSSLTTKLQPLLRERARVGSWQLTDVVFPHVIVGCYAAVRLGAAGRALLSQVYDTALRHFLTNLPPRNHRSFDLPAYVFVACPRVVPDKADIEAMLARLPLESHVTVARRQMGA